MMNSTVAPAVMTFGPAERERAIDALAASSRAPLDVLVMGGGITGVGVALDAVTRGLRVAIVERDDWACGTSSRSSKMIHGGLRYLGSGDVAVVRESLHERARIQRNAAHLCRPLPMLLPAYGRRGPVPWQRVKLGAGLWAYEALGHRQAAGSFHRWLSARDVHRIAPGVRTSTVDGRGQLRGGHAYHDGSADDVRLVLAVLRSAVARGALAANGARVTQLIRDGSRVTGAMVTIDIDQDIEVRARCVVNATGVWSDRTARDADGRDAGFRVQASKGVHLTVRRDRVGVDTGVAFFGQTNNENVFVEPWQDDLAIVGTTDTRFDGDVALPVATDDDVNLLFARINPFLREPLTRRDVLSAWAGLRPLVVPTSSGGRGERTQDVSRRHLIVDQPGLVTVTGGKLTAYRAMAQDAVDAVSRQLNVDARCVTHELRLDGWRTAASSAEIDALVGRLGPDATRSDARHLVRRHGANVPAVLACAAEQPELLERIHEHRPYLAAEAVWAATHEQARDTEDVLQRRTRLALEVRDTGAASLRIRELLGGVATTGR